MTLDGLGNPVYRIQENVAWDALEAPDSLTSLAPEADAICFGTLASRDPRSRAAIRRFLASAGTRCLRIFDVNLRQDAPDPGLILELLGRCDVLKLNEHELPVVAVLAGVPPDPEALRAAFNLRLVALTLGSAGSLLCTASEHLEEPGLAVGVADTVGAGDAFTAALAAGLAQGVTLGTLHRRAARLSAFVCTQEGATPETGDFIRRDPSFR